MTVLIVGAGPTGLVAALVLTASGVPCQIIEKRPSPGRSSRALGLQARSMEVLAGLGIAERVGRVAYRLTGASIMRKNSQIVEMAWVPPESRYPHTYVVPQSGLEDILRTRLGELGTTVQYGVELVEFAQGEQGITATLSDGNTIYADWLLGADGSRSRVRHAVGIGFPQRETGETYYLADALLDPGVELGDSAMWLGAQGPLMLMRLPGGRRSWRVFVDMTDAARNQELPPLTASALEDLLATRGPQSARIESVQWTSVFQTRMGMADQYRAGRVFLAGDAAHVFPPFGGQGMNLGIQDGVNIAWRLSSVLRGAPAELLDSYETERRPVAAATIRDVGARRRMYALRNPMARAARDLLLKVGGSSRRAARQGSLQNSQLATSYRRTTAGGDRGPSPRPGDRAPDAPLLGDTLHALLAPDHFVLVNFTGVEGDAGVVRSESALWTVEIPASAALEVRRRYEVAPQESAWVLIRPDGHVASRGDGVRDAPKVIATLMGERRHV
ncbi:MAG: FAD-dependent monooxygenase [Microbacterium sp.]|uniref:FAD-dependent monooxygenase n=1 Tax=Microbacterium sp. TaxID=51671 RepID=UPI003F9D61BC